MLDPRAIQRLNRKLSRFTEDVAKELRREMEKSAQEIVNMARRLVPVDEGDLRDSIGWTWGNAPEGAMTLGEVRGGRGKGNLRITIYAGNSKAFWARWVEFGTKKMRARPYFFPSYRANKKRMRGRITRATNKAARRIAAQASGER
ncbi:HK97-gp10 family putative phage morphogenesis protein [Pelagibacterium limicola]|uniref:HK97-gp10 family putative phage morphogenesis protein n=1 Tax=Pelagibacterium limicola TaxID=2791022 RepID=UPI0018AFB967|nr:HK97-gp10 family putative phage morphogenesis protein [Pelagibacterium limicola]